MAADPQIERYASVARQELNSGNRREPIWNEALTSVNGDEAVAQNLYVDLRIKQMMIDEVESEAARKARRERREFEDQLALNLWRKCAILGIGIVIGIALGVILMHHPHP